MTKTRSTKHALILSAFALLLCVSMLIGSTYAWFTDSVTSAGNIVKSGTLEVTMEWKDATATGAQQTYKDASLGAIFNYDKWEPGYIEAKNIKIGNAGTLALKYQLNIAATGVVSKLADVIDVYYAEGEYVLANRDMTELVCIGSLSKVLSEISTTASGDLLKGETDTVTLALKMKESAGNDYQDLAIGSDFTIQLLATQLTSEEDSFDDQYDVFADYDGEISNALSFNAALNNGGTYKVTSDIALDEVATIPAGVEVALDLNGKTVSGTVGRDADNNRVHTIVNKGELTLVDGTVASAGVNGGSAIYNDNGATMTVKNVTLNGAPQSGSTWPSYTVNNYGTLTLTDCSIYGVQGLFATNDTATTTANNVTAYRDGWSSGHVFYTSSTAKVTINGGTYTNDCNGVDGNMFYGGENVVNGGTFIVKEGAYFAIASGSKLTINDGDFTNIKTCYNWGGTMTVSGGTFGFDPTQYLANGYQAVKNTAGAYMILKGDVLASNNQGLNDAIAGGKNNIALGAGNYTMPGTSGDMTINGTTDTLITIDKPAAQNVTLNGVTVVGKGSYTGIQHSNTVVYKDCVLKGTQFLYADKVVIENCVIDLTDVADYIWTYSAKNVEFINCTFNTLGKAILIYNESPDLVTNVTVKGCTFNATASENKAAIEIDSSIATNGHYTITAENNTVDSNFTGEWRIKNSATDNTTVNGVIYNAITIDGVKQ